MYYKLRWLGYVLRREEIQAVRVVNGIYVKGKKGRGSLKIMWGLIENFMMWVGRNEEDTGD